MQDSAAPISFHCAKSYRSALNRWVRPRWESYRVRDFAKHALAYNFVNLFRQDLPLPLRRMQIDGLRQRLFKIGSRVRQTARRVDIPPKIQGISCSRAV